MAINHNILAKYGKYDGARAWEPAKGRTIRSNAEMRQMNASESVYKPVYKWNAATAEAPGMLIFKELSLIDMESLWLRG